MSKKNTASKSWYVFEFEGEFFTSLKKLTKEEAEDCLNRGRIKTEFPEFGVYGGMNLISEYYSSPQWTWKQAEEFANQMQNEQELGGNK